MPRGALYFLLFSLLLGSSLTALEDRAFYVPEGRSYLLAENVVLGNVRLGSLYFNFEGVSGGKVQFTIEDGARRTFEVESGVPLTHDDLRRLGIASLTATVAALRGGGNTAYVELVWTKVVTGTDRFGLQRAPLESDADFKKAQDRASDLLVPRPFRVLLKTVTAAEKEVSIGKIRGADQKLKLGTVEWDAGKSAYAATLNALGKDVRVVVGECGKIEERLELCVPKEQAATAFAYPDTNNKWALVEVRWLSAAGNVGKPSPEPRDWRKFHPEEPTSRETIRAGQVLSFARAGGGEPVLLTIDKIEPLEHPIAGDIGFKVLLKTAPGDAPTSLGQGDQVENALLAAGITRIAVERGKPAEGTAVLLLWGAKPTQAPTGFKVDHAPQVLSTLDNLVTLNITAQGSGGREPLLYQGPSVAEGSKFKDLPDLADRCLYFADKDGKPLGAKPADAVFADGKAQLFIGYKPGCPVCAGVEAIFELKLGLARNPADLKTIRLGVSCQADLLAVGRTDFPTVDAVQAYADALRKEKKSFRLVDLDSPATELTFSSGGLSAFGEKPWAAYHGAESKAVDLQSSEVRLFAGEKNQDDAAVRLDVLKTVTKPTVTVTFTEDKPKPFVDVAGLFSRDAQLYTERADGNFVYDRPEACGYTLFSLPEQTKHLQSAGLLAEGRLLQAWVRWSGTCGGDIAARAVDITGVTRVELWDADAKKPEDKKVLGGKDVTPATLDQFKLGVEVKLDTATDPRLQELALTLVLTKESQFKGTLGAGGGLKQTLTALGPVALFELGSTRRELTWPGVPATWQNLQVAAKTISYTDKASQKTPAVTLEVSFVPQAGNPAAIKEGERLAHLTVAYPERTLSFWIGEDRLYTPDIDERDRRIKSIRGDRVTATGARVTFSHDATWLTRHARQVSARHALKTLKRAVEPEAILLLGGESNVPLQTYLDSVSADYDGSVYTDDPYMYSLETPVDLLHRGIADETYTLDPNLLSVRPVKDADYRYPLGRLPGTDSESLSKLLTEAVAARSASKEVNTGPSVINSLKALDLAQASQMVSLRVNAESVYDSGEIIFKEGASAPLDKVNLRGERQLIAIRANNSGAASDKFLANGARGYVGVSRFVNAAGADQFLDKFYEKLQSSVKGETIAGRFLSARQSLARDLSGKEEFAHVQAVRYYGDPALPAKR
jgi:hypothetical protein